MRGIVTRLLTFVFSVALLSGCGGGISLLPDPYEPLKEVRLEGTSAQKLLVLPIRGVIDDRPKTGLLLTHPSLVEETMAMLDMARADPSVKAVLLMIDSPGGSVTASDTLYHEIRRFRQETGKLVVAMMGNVAASGGYYIACAADAILAHPTTITGSIGVIFLTANIQGLMEIVGVQAEPIKSGVYKDMGALYRPMTPEERGMLQKMVDELYDRFVNAVAEGRKGKLTREQIVPLADGRIYTSSQALQANLIDKVAYPNEAVEEAVRLAKLPASASVVVYRRHPIQNDNLYNTSASAEPYKMTALIDLGLDRYTFIPHTGFYYLWEPGLSGY